MSENRWFRLIILSSLAALSLFVLSLFPAFGGAQQQEQKVGRYQAVQSTGIDGWWICVTIIDTSTGKIVSQERYNINDKYKVIK
jgi:hypothetical protein